MAVREQHGNRSGTEHTLAGSGRSGGIGLQVAWLRGILVAVVLVVAGCTQPPSITISSPSATPPASRAQLLQQSEDALQRGDVQAATATYERVLTTAPASETDQQRQLVDGFTRFRLMVLYTVEGREDQARAQLSAEDSQAPSSVFTRLSDQYWHEFGMTAEPRAACAQLAPQVTSQAQNELASLKQMGLAVDAASLCRVPG